MMDYTKLKLSIEEILNEYNLDYDIRLIPDRLWFNVYVLWKVFYIFDYETLKWFKERIPIYKAAAEDPLA